MRSNQVEGILLVEDDPGHARLIIKNLRRTDLQTDITVLKNGQQALDYLFHEGTYQEDAHPLPRLVLLDLNLPVLDGYQVLQRLKADERTKRIPVIVLTTTDSTYEIQRCYDLGCSAYLIKPVDYDRFCQAIQKLGAFLSTVTTPGRE